MTPISQDFVKVFIPPDLRNGGLTSESLQKIVLNIIYYYFGILLAISAFISFCYIIFGGYKMFTAFGNEANFTQGKKIIISAIIGLIISVLAQAIIIFFARLFGYSGLSPFNY